MNSSRTPNESALSEETDQPEKKFLPEIKRQVESTWIVNRVYPYIETHFLLRLKKKSQNSRFYRSKTKKWKKKSRSRHGQNPGRVYKIELQCKKWYETYIFYLTIVFVTPNTTRKISLRVSIVTKKIYKTFSFKLGFVETLLPRHMRAKSWHVGSKLELWLSWNFFAKKTVLYLLIYSVI